MYRCFLFPHIFYEYDTEGKAVHYSTKSGKTEAGMMYTDNGFWDTFRTLYPLYGLLIPDKLKEMLEGMVKNATTASGTYLNGRIGVSDYVEKGYVPADKYRESINNSLDAYYCDYGILQIARLLGKEELAKKLVELFATPPVYEVGSYPGEIHEMTEMANADFGQCAISNQPSFHIPYLYAAIGEKEKTAYWVSRMVQEAFNSTEKGFPGDEDNGSMGAWYVFSVLGIYPLCPGKAEYVTGICNAKEIKVSITFC